MIDPNLAAYFHVSQSCMKKDSAALIEIRDLASIYTKIPLVKPTRKRLLEVMTEINRIAQEALDGDE